MGALAGINLNTHNPHSAIPHDPVLHKWRPRDGQNQDYEIFFDSLQDALVSMNLDPKILDYKCPTMDMIRKTHPRMKEPQLTELLSITTQEFQQQGGVIYRLVKPAMLIDGVHEAEDLESMRSFKNGLLRDGRGLLRWSMSWSDPYTIESQANIRAKMDSLKFVDVMTLASFHHTSRVLWKLWCRLVGNDPQYPDSFWQMYLMRLPGNPSTSHMAQIRSHLANRIMDNHPLLLDPPAMMAALEKLGKAIGIAEGGMDKLNPHGGGRIVRSAFSTPLHMCFLASAGAENDGLTSLCQICDVPFCMSECRNGFQDCICWPDSEFDAQMLPPSLEQRVMAARQYILDNQCESVKSIEF